MLGVLVTQGMKTHSPGPTKWNPYEQINRSSLILQGPKQGMFAILEVKNRKDIYSEGT